MSKVRTEKDSIGEIDVAAHVFWGAQTQRSVENFAINDASMPWELIEGLIILKRCAAKANGDLGAVDKKIASAIIHACDSLLKVDHRDHFPLIVWQTGSGTQTNMNINEVIANVANQSLGQPLGTKSPVHPNDHVNYGQSSNDSFPTAMHIATALKIENYFLPALARFEKILAKQQEKFKDILKVARTHLQDATPMTVGQEFSAFVQQVKHAISFVKDDQKYIYRLAQGATAVGTGLNCPKGFVPLFIKHIKAHTKLPFMAKANGFESLATNDALVRFSGTLATIASSFNKIANDIRWLGSGPMCGLGELTLPSNEPGSSIMPGKVNPTQAEALSMICCQVIGNHQAVIAGSMQGHFQLNVYKPMIIHNVIRSITLLSDGIESFGKNCIKGLKVNEAKLAEYIEKDLMLVTALNPIIGYDKAAEIAKYALKHNVGLKAACVSLGYLDEASFDKAVDPRKML